jgi:5-methylcytosine-specific restriction endonuclease McrA
MKNEKCPKCKNINMFSKNNLSKDKCVKVCKKCISEYKKQYYQLNKEKIKLKTKLRFKKNKKQIKIQKKKYYQLNKAYVDQKNNEWKNKNIIKHREYQAEYRKLYKKERQMYDKKYRILYREKRKMWAREYSRKRRAIKIQINENYTHEHEKITCSAFGNKCVNCGKKTGLAIDHHRPISKGNPLTLSNAVLLCSHCNSSKGNKNPEEFYGIKKCKILDKKLKKIAKSF